jgi:protein-S-isoprenylcysteine O-methyltransferase Ste14
VAVKFYISGSQIFGIKPRSIPPVYFFILALLSIALHFLFPIRDIMHFPLSYSGLVLVAVGVALNIWANRLFVSKGTTEEPSEKPTAFVPCGPFRFTRNPMYLGGILILIGEFVVSGAVSTLACPIIFFVIMDRMFIPLEERNMEKAFGKEYTDYRKRVRRWL